jgi:hypothetical protein
MMSVFAACSSAPHEPARPSPPPTVEPQQHHLDELVRPPEKKLLSIDWPSVQIKSAADALALWQQIAPTGMDWEEKLAEVPGELEIAHELAIALLAEGNFTCASTPGPSCVKVPLDVESPAMTATLTDPCLRRLLALWSLAQLEPEDLPRVRDALRAIVAIPPPESQLVARALGAVPETDLDGRLELLAIAWTAGQHELVDAAVGTLDEAHLITAATKLHVDGALEALSAEHHRATYLTAVIDEQMATAARTGAIVELAATADKLAPDVHTALLAAAKSPDCTIAATAARTLDLHGDHKLVPKLPHTRSTDAMMRALCVLASFEQQQRADEGSFLPGYIPTTGLELVRVTYDPYNDVDTDGDGDPHTEHHADLVKPNEVVLPEIDDLVRAMRHCTGTSCKSDDHEFKFTFKPAGGGLLLSKLEVIDRPPCVEKVVLPSP